MATVADLGNDPNKQSTPQGNAPSGTATPTSGGNISSFNAANAQPAQPQGSGQFTNLNKYLNANQNAGQQIGGAIQTGINQDLSGQQRQATTQADAFKQGALAGAQGNVATGVGYLGQVGGNTSTYAPGYVPPAPTGGTAPTAPIAPVSTNPPATTAPTDYSSMLAIANDPTKLAQFTGLRSGTTQQADQAALTSGLQNTQRAATSANQELAQRQGQLQGESNRFGLLNEFLGSKTYNQGAQTLDQAFLQRDKNNTLNNLQQNLQGQTGDFNKLTANATDLGKQAISTQTQEQQLAKDLGMQTQTNAANDINSIQGRVAGVNAQRTAEQQKYTDFLAAMKGDTTKTVDPEVLKAFGLQKGMHVFDTFNNVDNINQYANMGAAAKDYHDIANQNDVSQYAGLSKLAGIDPAALTQAGNLGAAVTAKTGQDSLLNSILSNYNSNIANAANDTLNESRDYSWRTGNDITGYDKHVDTATAQQNMGDLLKAGGVSQLTPDQISNLLNQLPGAATANPAVTHTAAPTFGNRSDTQSTFNPLTGGAIGNAVSQAVLGSSFNDFLSNATNVGWLGGHGTNQGQAANNATADAQQALIQDIRNYQNKHNWNTVI